MLSAEERLIPVCVKIKRAKKHLAELEAAAETYRDSYTHVAAAEENPKFAQGQPQLRKLPIIHFDMLAIAGDVLQNLRSSLDHLIYQLALVANPDTDERVLQTVSFPIGKSLQRYESLRGRKIKGVIEPRAVEFIDRLKPYKGGNDALWRLHEANNIDKHRRLISIGVNGVLCDGDGFDGYYWLKAENPSFTNLHFTERQQNAQLGVGESVGQPHVARGDALIPSLHQIAEFVEILVERRFKIFLDKP